MESYEWLEEVEGEEALSWVEERNQETLTLFEADPRFEGMRDAALTVLEADDKIAWGTIRGDRVYNFWQDADHVRGLWRRTTRSDYDQDRPDWEVVLDLDALAADEDENWVWRGAAVNADDTLALVSLSRGGKDASVVREFDLDAGRFVEGDNAFRLAEAKSAVSWVDDDTVLVGTDFGPGTLTDSGYPATLHRWRRGTALEESAEVHRVGADHVALWPVVQVRPEATYVALSDRADFFTQEIRLVSDDDTTTPLALPADVDFQGFFNGRALGLLRSPWRSIEAGALVALGLENGRVEVIWSPDERSSIAAVATSADVVAVTTLEDVASTLYLARPGDDGWQLDPVDLGAIGNGPGSVELISVPDDRAELFVAYNDFLTPPTLLSVDTGDGSVASLRHQPEYFDASGLAVEQHVATSADGTRIPYFHVGPADAPTDGSGRVVLYGYGGFEIALTPAYRAVVGKLWLEPGNHFVIANIRGGGEYGPEWHQAALATNRDRAFEDFEAVAEDLIARGITSPDHLGISGGSNGGLLVGSAFTRRPDLYAGVFCAVPLLDMLRFHTLLAGASWIAEYGNPEDPAVAEFWSTRSPLHRVSADADYPEVFFYTSTRDDRVHPAHARKMVARMTDLGHQVYYYENTEGGHAAGANLKQQARLDALTYVYFNRVLGGGSNEPPVGE